MAKKQIKVALVEATNLQGNVVKTDTYTATATDYLIVCFKGSAMDIELPTATGSNKVYKIKNIGAGVVTVNGFAAEVIDSANTKTLNQWYSLEIIDYIAGKWVIT